MSSSLRELSDIEYGASPKEIRAGDRTPIGIYGTSGFLGYANKSLFSGPLVVVARKGTLDNPVFVEGDCWVIDTAFVVLPKSEVEAKWLYYQLSNYDLKKLNESTGVPSISRDYLYRLSFANPGLPHQQKISRILTTVDKVIKQTENAIEKLKKIKQGMMHDLFTRGIDVKTGELRPPQSEASELYEKTRLGWLPKEWNTGKLSDVCDVCSSKRIYFHEYREDGVPFYRSKEIILKAKDIPLQSEIFISCKKYMEMKNKYGIPEVGDILITSVGTLGVTYQVREGDKFYFKDGNLIWLRKIKNINISNYLDSFLGMLINRQLDYLTIGTSQSAFTIDKLGKMKIVLIGDGELVKISNIMNKLRANIENEEKKLSKLSLIKHGLMQDLLTGKVEVEPDKQDKEYQEVN